MARRRIGQIAALAVLLTCAGEAFAEEECAQASDDCVAVGRWNLSVALGAGVRTNPLVQGKDIPLIVVPQFSYYGKRFFIDNLDPGVTLFEGDQNTLNLVASPGYDRVFFYRSDLQNFFIGNTNATGGAQGGVGVGKPPPFTNNPGGTPQDFREFPLRSRQITYLAGPEWTFKYAGISGQLDFLHEITGHHHGDEIRAGLGIPLGHWGGAWIANVGFTWKSAATVNYYYGDRGLYEAGWAANPFVKLGYSRPLGGKWKLDAFVHCERLGNAIADSPLINQRYVTTAFVGATYVVHK